MADAETLTVIYDEYLSHRRLKAVFPPLPTAIVVFYAQLIGDSIYLYVLRSFETFSKALPNGNGEVGFRGLFEALRVLEAQNAASWIKIPGVSRVSACLTTNEQ